ncbi:MAG TPA: ABC transporter substrate-binding protein, partial [Acidimicrobiia bacterium]|nr:ABC transporter substrate-binding protein [Acidimicrobiia bacterium]
MSRRYAPGCRPFTYAGIIALLVTTACGASPRVERAVAARHAAEARTGATQQAANVVGAAGGATPSDAQAGVAPAAGGYATTPVSGPAARATPSAGGGTKTGPASGPAGAAAGSGTGAAAGGGSSSGGAAVPQAPAAPADGNGGATDTGVTATSIKIGGTFFNGNYLDKYSQVTQQAATAYFRYINDQGGIYGRKIEFVGCDTAGTADGTQGCLRKLANDNKVFSMGPSLDFNLDTVQPFLEQQKLPWIGDSGLYPAEYSSPWMFPSQIPGPDVGALIGTFSGRTLGAKTIGVSYLNDVAGPACTDRVKEIGKSVGYTVVVTAQNSQTQGDLTQQVLTIQAAHPDAVLFCNDPVNTIKFVQAAGRVNYRPPKGWVAGFVAADDVPQSMGAAGVGLYGFSSFDFYAGDTPGVRQFRQITEHYYPSIFHHFYTQAAYAGAEALVEAIKKAGPRLTRAGLVAAMKTFSDFDTTMGL